MLNASFTFLPQGLEHGNISSIRNKTFLIQLFDQTHLHLGVYGWQPAAGNFTENMCEKILINVV